MKLGLDRPTPWANLRPYLIYHPPTFLETFKSLVGRSNFLQLILTPSKVSPFLFEISCAPVMLSIIYIATSLTLTILVQAGPVQLNHTKGGLPIVIDCVEELGDVHSETTYVKRDLGFQGQIGNNIVITYGDTMFSDPTYSDTFRGMTSDSMALATHNPLNVIDLDLDAQGFPKQFCPIMGEYNETSSECAMGITNVVETYSGQGTVIFQ